MKELLLVISGGIIGTSSRYFVYRMGHLFFIGGSYTSTLLVNALGSFLFGLFLTQIRGQSHFALFFAMGIIGSFTTFSTFSYESMLLLKENKMSYFVLNILANVCISFFCFYLGDLIQQKTDLF